MKEKNSSCARKQIESITTTSWWGSQCSKFSAPYSYLNGCKQEFSNILQKVPKIGQKCSLACGLAAGRPIRGVCPNCRLTLHSAANSAFMTCLTNYVIIWGANSPTTSTSTSTSGIWEANFNTNTIVSITHLWYNWYNYYLSGRQILHQNQHQQQHQHQHLPQLQYQHQHPFWHQHRIQHRHQHLIQHQHLHDLPPNYVIIWGANSPPRPPSPRVRFFHMTPRRNSNSEETEARECIEHSWLLKFSLIHHLRIFQLVGRCCWL